jgi:beta-alanine--pyruvate transaminase
MLEMIRMDRPHLTREELEPYWMPFTGNRQFKADPRMIVASEGVFLVDDSGRRVLDGLSGLWCCGVGHNRREIAEAVNAQLQTLDYAPAFQFGHPGAFALASRLKAITPVGLDYAFFTNSGSEAVDTALKMARAYWRLRGKSGKTRFIGRARGYHGVNYGGVSVGGIPANVEPFGPVLETALLSSTLLPENAFSRGIPAAGLELAEELTALIARFGADQIAAVIVEPVVGSGGVVPPPLGYLERLRAICDENEILLIFDEVITGLGRCGAMTAAEVFGVVPDIMTLAKQLTNGAIPMGAVMASAPIYEAFMNAGAPQHLLEFNHGYTYSGHPVGCAAALAVLDILEQEALPQRVAKEAMYFEDVLHELKGAPHLRDIRNFGFAGGLQLAPMEGDPTRRPFEVAMRMWHKGFYVRYGGDIIALGLPFIMERNEIDSLVTALGEVLDELD